MPHGREEPRTLLRRASTGAPPILLDDDVEVVDDLDIPKLLILGSADGTCLFGAILLATAVEHDAAFFWGAEL